MRPPLHLRLRRWPGALILVITAALLLPLLGVSVASADPIADKRAEASRLARQLDQMGERLSVLDEAYNRARLQLSTAQTRVATAKAKAAATQTRYDQAVRQARQRAVAAYVDGGSLSKAVLLPAAKDVRDLTVRREYLRAAAGDDRRVLDELKAAREDLDAQRANLDSQTAAAKAAAAKVKSNRDQAAAALANQQRLLAQAQGDLSRLVAAEEARQAAAAAEKARAAIAARIARESAAPRAVPGRASRSAPLPPADSGAPDPASAPPPSGGAGAAVAFARQQLGKPYEWGAAGPDSYDCSGLTMAAWRQGGVSLPHSSSAQYSSTTHVSMSDLQPGDLLFYGSDIHHVGIYVGGGQMIEAPHSGTVVRYASIYRSDLVGAGRPG